MTNLKKLKLNFVESYFGDRGGWGMVEFFQVN